MIIFFFSEPNKIEGVVLSKQQFESYVRELLLVKQYRVEVFVNQGTGKNQEWKVEFKGSPGNLSQFEELLFGNSENAESSNVIAVKLDTVNNSKVIIKEINTVEIDKFNAILII